MSYEAWTCSKCGGSAYEHSLETSTCIWEPVATGIDGCLEWQDQFVMNGEFRWVPRNPVEEE